MLDQARGAMAQAQEQSQMKRGGRFIEDEVKKPNTGRAVARWVLFFLMLLAAVQLLTGLYMVKHGTQIGGLKMSIGGAFFFIIFYATHWMLRD